MSIANGICDQSGFKVRLRRLKTQWDSAKVLPDWKDPRPKQLQVPPVRENMFAMGLRPEQPNVFIAPTESDILQQMRNNGIPT